MNTRRIPWEQFEMCGITARPPGPGLQGSTGAEPQKKPAKLVGSHATTEAQASGSQPRRQLSKHQALGDGHTSAARTPGLSLASLPPDCLALIFSMLEDSEDKESFCSCCKALRCEAVRSNIKCIYLNGTDNLDAVQGLARFSSFAPGLQELSIDVKQYFYRPFVEDGLQIVELLQACQEASAAGARLSLSRIRCLSIQDCRLYASNCFGPLVGLLKTLCPLLEEVQLLDVHVSDSTFMCPTQPSSDLKDLLSPLRLKALKFSPIDPPVTLIGIAQLTTLTRLCLDLSRDVCGRLENLAELSKLQHLQHLQLEGPFEFFPRGLDDVLTHCGQLKVLHLHSVPAYPLSKSPSLERLILEELPTDDLSTFVAALETTCAPEYHVMSLVLRPDPYRPATEVKNAALKLAGFQAVKWGKFDTLVLVQEDRMLSDNDSDYGDHEEDKVWDSSDDDERYDRVQRHKALTKTVDALEALRGTLQGSVTKMRIIRTRLEVGDTRLLAQLAGPSVQHISFEDCVLAHLSVGEAVRALPSLQHVRVTDLGRENNYYAVLDGINEMRYRQKQRQLLRVELERAHPWEAEGKKPGCMSRYQIEQENINEIMTKCQLREFAGKVEVRCINIE